MTQHLLGIELQSLGIKETDLDLPTITIFLDSKGNYYFSREIIEVQTAILGIIPHLGSNYCHPLLFNVQILPGDRMDAYLHSVKNFQGLTLEPRQRSKS